MKDIEKRGRTFDSVVNPKKYKPFSKIPDQDAFEVAWKSNPDWIFANMAHAAYCDRDNLKELFTNFGASIEFYESVPNKYGFIRGRQAFLATWHDKAILSFRGTEASEQMKWKVSEKLVAVAKKFLNINLPAEVKILFPTDLYDDAAFFKFTYREKEKSSQVHGGFYKATDELWPDIEKDLDGLSSDQKAQLFVTGHSLGAAMGLIAAMKGSFKEVVTFGEPSVGNNIDNTLGHCTHIRYVNGKDPVTKIIPEIVYEHHGDPISIEDIDGADMRYDHSIINYAEILEHIKKRKIGVL